LNLLSGLDRPTAGTVRWGGVETGRLDENAKARLRNQKIGFVFQFYHLLSEFSALENVMLPALIGKAGDPQRIREKAEALLGKVALKDRKSHFPSELSGGEQQRVAIARALMNDPEILFCDEPTGNLDPRMGAEIAELLGGFFRGEKRTLIVATHDEKIAGITDRVWNILTPDRE
jgi:ABC-type lipoprotein export system ATPase subunit